MSEHQNIIRFGIDDKGFTADWPFTGKTIRRTTYECDPSAMTWENCLVVADMFTGFCDELRMLDFMDDNA